MTVPAPEIAPVEAAERPRALLHWLSLVYLVFVALFSVWACYASFADRLTIPIVDDWRVLDEFHSKPLLDWLFAEQNGHRLVFTFGLFALDYGFFGGRQDLLVVASFVTAGLAIGVLYLGYRGEKGLHTPLARAAFGFAWFATFWAGASYNFLWGVCQGNLMVALWLFASLVCIVGYVHAGPPRAGRPHPLALAGLAAFFSTFSLGHGVGTWVALIAVAIAARLPGRTVGLLTLGFVMTLAVYSIGLGATGKFSFAASTAVLLRPVDTLTYVTAFLGSAPGRTAQGLGLSGPDALNGVSSALGGVGLLAFALYAAWLWRRPARAGPRELLAFGIMTFAVAAAAVVTVGRLPRASSADAVAMRFVNWSAMFWLGGVLAIPTLLRGARGSLAMLLVAAASLSMLPALERNREELLQSRARASEAALAVLLGIREPSLPRRMGVYIGLPLVTRDADLVERDSPAARLARFQRVVERLRRERRSFLAEPRAQLPGTALLDHFAVVPGERCSGHMAAPVLLPEAEPPAARVGGRLLDQRAERAPVEIVIADAAGVIRGLGIGRRAAGGAQDAADIPWSGYVAEFVPSERYTAYALLADGHGACPLGRRRAAARGTHEVIGSTLRGVVHLPAHVGPRADPLVVPGAS